MSRGHKGGGDLVVHDWEDREGASCHGFGGEMIMERG